MWHEEHMQCSGDPWSDLHTWLDQYFKVFGPQHRVILHHQEGVRLAALKFGLQAREVAEQHIIDDEGLWCRQIGIITSQACGTMAILLARSAKL